MAWNPRPQEIESLLRASREDRYKYFLNHACDSQKVIGLYEDGWAMLADSDGRPMMPLWPHALYAEKFKNEEWKSYQPKEISIDDFMSEWIPDMKSKGVTPAIFPIPSGNSIIISLEDLEANLTHELQKY